MASHPAHWQELASAYLLGHASSEEVVRFEALYREDAGFRALVTEMETFLAPLNTEAEEAEPPVGLLDDIMAEIEAGEARREGTGQVIRTVHDPHAGGNRERPWQWATAASLLIAVISLGVHLVPDQAETTVTPQEELVALMSGEETPSVVVLLYDKDTNTISGRLTNTSPPSDGVWQLWLLREGIDAPQSLGLLSELSEDGRIDLTLAEELAAGSDTLAISVEPEGGSPEAGPTGPIVFTGKVDPI